MIAPSRRTRVTATNRLNGARDWPARGEILTRPDDFGPPELNSDHRPVRATFEVEP